MNWTHIWRIAWKDYRRMSGLWWALFGFWFLCLSLWTISQITSDTGIVDFPITTGTLCTLVLTTAVIYALGWSGLTFAAEHEDKTYGLLRSLPLAPNSVFWGKFVFGLLSTVLLVVSLAILCFVYLEGVVDYLLDGRYRASPSSTASNWDPIERFGYFVMAATIPLAMVIGMFWSMRLKKPFTALTLAAICLVFVTQSSTLVAALACPNAWNASTEFNPQNINATAIAVALILCASVLLFIVDWRLAAWWLPTKQKPATASPLVGTAPASPPTSKPSGMRRMLWLSMKDNVWLSIGLAIAGIAVSVMILGPNPFPLVASAFLGVIVFRPDHQENRYRLLSQLGVKRSQYWFSRLWLPALCALLIAVAAAQVPGVSGVRSNGFDRSLFLRKQNWFFLAALSTFSIGQLCSMAFRSSIIASATTLILSIFVCWWTYFWSSFLDVPAALIHLPVVLLPLMATFLRVPRWFRETGSWKQWVIPLFPMALLFVGVPTATALYRIYEIPYAEVPEGMLLPPRTQEEEEQIAKFEQLQLGRVQGHPSIVELADSFEHNFDPPWEFSLAEEVDLLLDITEGPIAFPSKSFTTANEEPVTAMAAALIAKGRLELDDDAPAEAWKYFAACLRLSRQRNDGYGGTYGWFVSREVERAVYPGLVRWATHSETTVSDIEAAISLINEIRLSQLTYEEALRGDFTRSEEILNTTPPNLGLAHHQDAVLAQTTAPYPWERIRARRLRDYTFSTVPPRYEDPTVNWWADTTYLGHVSMLYLADAPLPGPQLVDVLAVGTASQLAAIAYKKENGEYPASLEDVKTPGIPNDPLSDSRLQIRNDSKLGPILFSAQAIADSGREPLFAFRVFLLPTRDTWDETAFRKREREAERGRWIARQRGQADPVGDESGSSNSTLDLMLTPFRTNDE